MADYKPAGDVRPGKGQQPPDFGTELIDVIMRGLGTAKKRLEAGDADPQARGQLCLGWYVDHDHSCALWYSNPA